MRLDSKLVLLLSLPLVVVALPCNLCGPGTFNKIGNKDAEVTIRLLSATTTRSCDQWQRGSLLNREWCEKNAVEYFTEPCECKLPNGTKITDLNVDGKEPQNEEELPEPICVPGRCNNGTSAVDGGTNDLTEDEDKSGVEGFVEDVKAAFEDGEVSDSVKVSSIVIAILVLLATCCCFKICCSRRKEKNEVRVTVTRPEVSVEDAEAGSMDEVSIEDGEQKDTNNGSTD